MSLDLDSFKLEVTGPFLHVDYVSQLPITVSMPDTINVLIDKAYFISHRVSVHQTIGPLVLDL